MSFLSDDAPVRLSLRERMALKEAQASSSRAVKPKEDSLKEYRKSREFESKAEKTSRRVIRVTDDGQEEVIVRERKYKNGEKEEVVKRVSRENENKQAITEDNEEEGEDLNNNVTYTRKEENRRPGSKISGNNDESSKRQTRRIRRTEDDNESDSDSSQRESRRHTRRDVEEHKNDVNKNRRNNTADFNSGEAEVVKIDGCSYSEETITKKSYTNGKVEEHTETKKTHHYHDNGTEVEETTTINVDTLVSEGSDEESETIVVSKAMNGEVSKHIEQKTSHHHHDKNIDIETVTITNVDRIIHADHTTSEKEITTKVESSSTPEINEKNDKDSKLSTGTKSNIFSRANANVSNTTRDNKVETTPKYGRSDLRSNKRPDSVGDFKSKFESKTNARSSPTPPKIQGNNVIVIEDVVVTEEEVSVESANIGVAEAVEPKENDDKLGKLRESKSVNLRNKFENNTSNRPVSVGNFKSRFENKSDDKLQNKRPVSVGDFRNKFEVGNKVGLKSRDTTSKNGNVKKIDEKEERKARVEEQISAEAEINLNSANVKPAEIESKPKENEAKDKVSELNDNKTNNVGNKYTRKTNTRPASVVDFKSKFETKSENKRPLSTGTFPTKISAAIKAEKSDVQDKLGKLNDNKSSNMTNRFENKLNKRPVSVGNFRSKFETKDTEPVLDKRPVSAGNFRTKLDKKNALEDGKEKENEKPLTRKKESTESKVKNTSTSKSDEKTVVTDNGKGRTEESVTKVIKGHGQSAQEISQKKIVETKDKDGMHMEKVTTVTETKTAGGKYTRRTIETKIEAKQDSKTNAPSSKNMEAILKERKKKQEAAKKAQADKMAKGRNMFKQMDAKAQVGMKVTINAGGGGGGASNNIEKLLKWIAKRLNQYPAVNVTNFTSSWADGIAMCAMMNYLLGDKAINPLAVSTTDKRKNFHMAIQAATDAGVPALLDADELADLEIDRRSMITYLHLVYKILYADKQETK